METGKLISNQEARIHCSHASDSFLVVTAATWQAGSTLLTVPNLASFKAAVECALEVQSMTNFSK